MQMKIYALAVLVITDSFSNLSPAVAAETITYSYDVQGRLVSAAHSGTGPNSGLNIQSQQDLTDNRTVQAVTGSKNNGQQVVVLPIGDGFKLIPINP